ncbi:MAG: substrate-binding domain-containing protein [Chloroflexota bacterium]|jgi:Ca-activated chloride channel family protein
MNRTRVVFVTIISLTLLIILGAVLAQIIGGNESGVEDEAATPLPPDTVLVTLASSNTKESWLDQVVAQFNAAGRTTAAGNRIVAEVEHVTSGGSMNAILDGSLMPVAWSPGDGSWVEQINQSWQQRTNKPINSQACQPTVYAPLGFALWRPMAEALGWPDTPIGWDTIVDLAADPDGWASYGRPEWGQFRFGHTHPAYANSGLLSMTAFVHGIVGRQEQLTPAQVYEAEDAMRALEQTTSKYGRQAPAMLDLMARQGPSFLHGAAVPEADTVRFNVERGDELQFPLAFIFPSGGTIWADHPYCILDNAEWVSQEQAEAAAIFRDYLLDRDQQELAVDNYLRPLDSTIALHAPMTLENGTDPRVTTETVPALPSPDADVSAAVIDLFRITKRKATVIIALDVSGSMEGDKIRSATAATGEFLGRLDPNDEVALLTFSDGVTLLSEPARVGDVVEGLAGRVASLIASGNTALYDAVCQATTMAAAMKAQDEAAGESRLYGVVLLSDGEDTVGEPTENQMFVTCLPANAEADGVKIFPVAFGEDASEDVLERIATVTGGRMYSADPASISNVYLSISAEQ